MYTAIAQKNSYHLFRQSNDKKEINDLLRNHAQRRIEVFIFDNNYQLCGRTWGEYEIDPDQISLVAWHTWEVK